jgi:peptidoglycan LD-endopeptidase LytH
LKGTRAKLSIALAASLTLAVLVSSPLRADTSSDLEAERQQLASLQADLDKLARSYAKAESQFAETQRQIEETQAKLQAVRARLVEIQDQLGTRARIAYETGGGGTLEALLSSEDFGQFSDRVAFLGRLAQSDSDLLLAAQVAGEQLRRYQASLNGLSDRQAATLRSLGSQKRAIAAKFAETQSAVSELTRKLRRERAAAAARARALSGLGVPPSASGTGTVINGRGPLQSCPVGQPRSFVDTFGAPRPGGRTHQGIDLMAPYGTPIFAAQSGRFQQNYNSLGGTSALVYADNGDSTYYAHMSSYAGVPNGAHVPAGQMIGHVGNTGDASGGPYHLHFEYHPGGGGAIDPYSMLRAVCG